MAQNEQRHAHELREKGLNGAIAKDRRGQWLGAAIANDSFYAHVTSQQTKRKNP